MVKNVTLLALAATLVLATGYADQTRKITVPVNPTDPTSGKQMYTSYCAGCHGAEGRGNGPVAAVLTVRPSDLTVLARSNHGKFPATHVTAVLQYGPAGSSHGSVLMPQWGVALGNISSVYQQQERDLRVHNLTRYIETMQVK